MPVYARSDVAAVTISSHHGGCGDVHSRPVIEGAPVKVWALTCHNGCEDVLRNDSLWSATIHQIPETPDEQAHRENVEKRGAVEQHQTTAEALTQLAKMPEIMALLTQVLVQQNPGALQSLQNVAQLPSGSPTEGTVTSTVAPVEDAVSQLENANLDGMSFQELKEVAKTRGVKGGRSRDELLGLLKGGQS